MKRAIIFTSIITILSFITTSLYSQAPVSFTTITDGSWSNPLIWQGLSIPSNGTTLQTMNVYHAVELDSFSLFTHNTLNISSTGVLTINGILKLEGPHRAVHNYGHIILNGDINVATGSQEKFENFGLITVNSSLTKNANTDYSAGTLQFTTLSSGFGKVADIDQLTINTDSFTIGGASVKYDGMINISRNYDDPVELSTSLGNTLFTVNRHVSGSKDSFVVDGMNLVSIKTFRVEATPGSVVYFKNFFEVTDTMLISSDVTIHTNPADTIFPNTATALLIVEEDVVVTIDIGSTDIYFYGDIQVDGTLDINGSMEQLTGEIVNGHKINSSKQSRFKKLKIRGKGINNNPVFMNGDFIVEEELEFLSDIKIVTGEYTLVITNPSPDAIKGLGAGRYIQGNLRRAVGGPGNYVFPVGNANGQRQAIMEVTSIKDIEDITVTYSETVNDRFPLDIPTEGPYDSIISVGKWIIEPDNYSGEATYNLIVDISFVPGLVDNRFGLLKRPTASVSSLDWYPAGELADWGMPGRTVAAGFAVRYDISTFSEFGIGISDDDIEVSILSIEYNSIQAYARNRDAVIEWSTLMEENNQGFVVQRSFDSRNWENTGLIPGAGNSSIVINYSFVDEGVFRGHGSKEPAFYRLKQVDFNGDYSYSQIKAVEPVTEDARIQLYPNPVNDYFHIQIFSAMDDNLIVQITDMAGRTIKEYAYYYEPGRSTMKFTAGDLPAGMYFIHILQGQNSYSQKFIKN